MESRCESRLRGRPDGRRSRLLPIDLPPLPGVRPERTRGGRARGSRAGDDGPGPRCRTAPALYDGLRLQALLTTDTDLVEAFDRAATRMRRGWSEQYEQPTYWGHPGRRGRGLAQSSDGRASPKLHDLAGPAPLATDRSLCRAAWDGGSGHDNVLGTALTSSADRATGGPHDAPGQGAERRDRLRTRRRLSTPPCAGWPLSRRSSWRRPGSGWRRPNHRCPARRSHTWPSRRSRAAIAVAARRFAVGPTTARPPAFQALTIAAFLTGFADAALGIVSGAVGSSVTRSRPGSSCSSSAPGSRCRGRSCTGRPRGERSAQQPRPRPELRSAAGATPAAGRSPVGVRRWGPDTPSCRSRGTP